MAAIRNVSTPPEILFDLDSDELVEEIGDDATVIGITPIPDDLKRTQEVSPEFIRVLCQGMGGYALPPQRRVGRAVLAGVLMAAAVAGWIFIAWRGWL
jgi:hypothetical protein